MTPTRKEKDDWIKTANDNNFKYILSVCDKSTDENYAVYFKTLTDLFEKYNDYDFVGMKIVNEIIKINIDGSITEHLKLHNL